MVTNIKALKEKVDKCIITALEETRKFVGGTLLNKIADYYDEYEPIKYHREYILLDSLTTNSKYSLDNGKVMKVNDGYEFKIGWDDAYLNFYYKNATGEMVLQWLDNKTHGGWQYDNNAELFEHRFFSETIEELGGRKGIINIFKQNLRKTRLPVKK